MNEDGGRKPAQVPVHVLDQAYRIERHRAFTIHPTADFVGGLAAVVAIGLGRGLQLLLESPEVTPRLQPLRGGVMVQGRRIQVPVNSTA